MSRVSVTCEKCSKSTQRAERSCTKRPCPVKGCGGKMARRVPGLKADEVSKATFNVTSSRSPFQGMRIPLVMLPDDVRVERTTLQALRAVSRRRPTEVAARILNAWAREQAGG